MGDSLGRGVSMNKELGQLCYDPEHLDYGLCPDHVIRPTWTRKKDWLQVLRSCPVCSSKMVDASTVDYRLSGDKRRLLGTAFELTPSGSCSDADYAEVKQKR